MANRYEFYEDAIDIYFNTQTKGLAKDHEFYKNFLSSDMVYYTIPIHMQYRPDLIAYKFYKDSSLDWVLTFVNQFDNSPEDYYTDRVILIPSLTRIKQLV